MPEPLARIAKHIPLVILSNAMNDQIGHNVAKLGAPFYAVYTAQQAQAYKPRLQAFEYMLDNLCCNPEDVLHVSSSLRYDLMSAHDLGIKQKAFRQTGATNRRRRTTAMRRSRTSRDCPLSSDFDDHGPHSMLHAAREMNPEFLSYCAGFPGRAAGVVAGRGVIVCRYTCTTAGWI